MSKAKYGSTLFRDKQNRPHLEACSIMKDKSRQGVKIGVQAERTDISAMATQAFAPDWGPVRRDPSAKQRPSLHAG